jgi:hypothetical protein
MRKRSGLDAQEHNANNPALTTGTASPTTLLSSSGSLAAADLIAFARLAAKFGPEISLRDLTDRFYYDCLWRAEARSKKGKSACCVYLPDLETRDRLTCRRG